ncbi:MAG TPA: hypothetical protein VFA21_00770 [Pyrinomonadaceae bacterium]|nr:hypothetical protein [Pyrinomonadaceae bacterium]
MTGQHNNQSASGAGVSAARFRAGVLRFIRRTAAQENSSSRPSRLLVALCAVALLSAAQAGASVAPADASIKVVNNSEREIINLYLSHEDSDDFGPDLLPDSTVKTGESFTITDVTCDQPKIKVTAEDKDTCFLSTVVSCGDAVTWTITKDTPAECDGN